MPITINGSGITLDNLSPKGGQVRYLRATRRMQQSFGNSGEWTPHMHLHFKTYVVTNALFIFSPSVAYESTSAPQDKSLGGQVRFEMDGVPFGSVQNFVACGAANSGCTSQPLEAFNSLPAGSHVMTLSIRNNGLIPGYTAYDAYSNPYYVPESRPGSTLITPYNWDSLNAGTNNLIGMIFGDGDESNVILE